MFICRGNRVIALPGQSGSMRQFWWIALADGRAIGVEIIDPSQCGPDRLIEVLRSLGYEEIDRDEFRPLAAA